MKKRYRYIVFWPTFRSILICLGAEGDSCLCYGVDFDRSESWRTICTTGRGDLQIPICRIIYPGNNAIVSSSWMRKTRIYSHASHQLQRIQTRELLEVIFACRKHKSVNCCQCLQWNMQWMDLYHFSVFYLCFPNLFHNLTLRQVPHLQSDLLDPVRVHPLHHSHNPSPHVRMPGTWKSQITRKTT